MPAVLLRADATAACSHLAGGLLACPPCGTGRLAWWGHGPECVIRLLGGAAAAGPARCRSCTLTHVCDVRECLGQGSSAAVATLVVTQRAR